MTKAKTNQSGRGAARSKTRRTAGDAATETPSSGRNGAARATVHGPGIFDHVREAWVASGMLGLALLGAVAWVAVPGDADSSLVVTVREQVAALGPEARDERRAQQEGARLARRSQPDSGPQLARLPASTVTTLEQRFDRLDYSLEAVRARDAAVPRILPEEIPRDLGEIKEVERKKAIFLEMVLPLVLIENERLRDRRARVIALSARLDRGETLEPADRRWLDAMYERYRVESGKTKALLRRVDVVPPSLALAQAAIESGWGTSRFAREGNALFGQWVWGDDAEGLVPSERESGKSHKIRTFQTPLQAVAAYIKNLNTHAAYAKLRRMRADLRAQGAGLNGQTLAGGLESYSEKGMAYVDLVRQIISANELRPLDQAELAAETAAPPNV